MLELRKGNKVPFPKKLSEGYDYNAPYFTANVNSNKIEVLLKHFISVHNEPLFVILELPSKQEDQRKIRPGTVEALHKDVYYIDGCTQKEALTFLRRSASLLINDGLCSFGFGCHQTHDEIMVGKYNVITIYCRDKKVYDGFFEQHDINPVTNLVTAWDTFTQESPGESERVDTNGESVFDIPNIFKEWGIYLASQKES